MQVSYTSPYVVSFALATVVAAVTTVVGWQRRDRPGARAFVVFMLCVTAWAGVATAGFLLPTLGRQVLAHRLKWTVVPFVPVYFLAFAVQYAGHDRYLGRRRLAGLTAVSVLLAAGVWANPADLMWAETSVIVREGIALLRFSLEPLYWTIVAYVLVLAVPATALLLRLALVGQDLYLGQVGSVLVGAVVPLVAGTLSAFTLTPLELDFTPVGFAVSGVAFGYALTRQDLLRTTPATTQIGRDTVVRNMRDGVVVVDTRGRVVDLNPVAERVLDVDPEALLDSPAADLDGLEREPGDTPGYTGEISTGDGRLFEVQSSALEDGRGRRLGTVVVLQDVTELRNRQQRLTVLNRVLRHNLRNDMNAIDGYATMLADRFDAPPAQRVRAVSDDVIELADKAREIERVMSRRGETEPGTATRLVETVVDAVRPRFEATITVDTPDEPVVVPGRGLLEPALENVVENAAEHNDADEPTVTVEVTADDGVVEFRVADNGPGIPPQEREVLLEGTETALAHGSGLGLWLVYWSVESLDGEVVFDDNRPRGSVVTVRVPSADDETMAGRGRSDDADSDTGTGVVDADD